MKGLKDDMGLPVYVARIGHISASFLYRFPTDSSGRSVVDRSGPGRTLSQTRIASRCI